MTQQSLEEKELNQHNLFQQIGNIQGTLVALNTNISDFKSEVRSLTNDQNRKIEEFRREVSQEIKDLTDNTRILEDKKVDKTEIFRLQAEAEKAHAKFVTQEEFALPKKLIYSAVTVILVGFMTALITLVFD